MLDLDAWIDSMVGLTAAGIDEKLHGPRIVEADCSTNPNCGVENALSRRFIEFSAAPLNYLLMPSLNRAIAFEQMDQIAVSITE
jgi:hypothetical protein